jgi:hypothetical protein
MSAPWAMRFSAGKNGTTHARGGATACPKSHNTQALCLQQTNKQKLTPKNDKNKEKQTNKQLR